MKLNSLQFKKALRSILFVLLLGAVGMTKGYAFDFSAVCSTGDTLYYNIIDANNHYVELTYPGESDTYYWSGFTKPTGNLILPESVQYAGVVYSVTSIHGRAFSYCTGLTSIEIPNSVTSIDWYAFYSCSGLTSIEIPNSVTSIEYATFERCTGLTSIVIPDSVTYIGGQAFWGCTGLTSIEIPNSVTSIGDRAFLGCTGLTSIEIPNSVTYIGYGAFYGCTGLTSIEIPNSVTYIGYGAFYGCTGLTSIEIPNSVTSIGSFAFYGCTGLTSITVLARNPPTLGEHVFYNVNPSIPVYVPSGLVGTYSNISWGGFTHFVEIFICGDKIIGNGYTYPCDYLPSHSYYKYALSQQIYTTDELGTAGYIYVIGFYNAGAENTRTYDIYLKPTLKDSFSYADWEIVSDSNLVFSGDVTMQANDWTYITLDTPFAYDGNRNVVLVMDDNTGSYNTSEPFMSCHVFSTSEAQAIFIYNDNTNYDPSNPPYTCTTQSVKNQLFVTKDLTSTFNVSVSANPPEGGTVTGAGPYTQGQTCTVTATANPGYVFVNWTTENGTEVSNQASFDVTWNRTLVANFELGTPVDIIVFADATVKALCVAPTTNWDTNGDGELTYAEAAAVTSLGNVFYRKSSITSFDELRYFIGLTSIGNNAFERCTSLASIVLPNSVDSIGNYAFERCDSLTTIELSNSLTYIGEEAFKICGSLTTIEIPNSVTFIKDGAFSQCEGLSSMTVWAENPPALGYYVFNEVNKSIPVYVPCGSLEAYQDAAGWNEFTNIQEVCSQTQTIQLAQGWNWFSTYLDITLDDLKTALVEALPGTIIHIKSQTQNTSYNPNNQRWSGSLTWDVAKMYCIKTATPCEITLEGTPVNLAERIIYNGYNWIGFPLSESMSVSNAFAGFVVNGDIIKSKTNNASYINGQWRGNLNTLEPGQGYIYKSNVQGDRIFTFPISTK